MLPLNLNEKFAKIHQFWTPKIIAELNDQYIKLAKVKGELVWHDHENEDELFIIHKGTLWIDFEDKTVELKPGDMFVVPKGVSHNPRTGEEEVWLVLIEPKSTTHTGKVQHEKTQYDLEWI